jgi:dTDP-4-dehydrorhamnose 3,5-epimerase
MTDPATKLDASVVQGELEVTPAAPRDQPTTDPSGRPWQIPIEGVEVVHLQRHVDHRGSLIEAINVAQNFWREPIVHCEYVVTAPGRIKGWGMHKKSYDRYVAAHGRVRVVLFDGRTGSPTYENFAQFHFGDEAPGLLRIPPGVWHANQNYGETDAVILVFPTLTYQHSEPDKYRLDPQSGEIPFDWTLKDG